MALDQESFAQIFICRVLVAKDGISCSCWTETDSGNPLQQATYTQKICALQLILYFHVFNQCVFCRDCKVITDPVTGKSKGYGFITFVNREVRV